jgi:hypothetical protein
MGTPWGGLPHRVPRCRAATGWASDSSKTAVVHRDGFKPTIEVMRAGHRRGGVATGNLTRDPSEEK